MKKTIFFTHNKNDFNLFFDKRALNLLDKNIKIIRNQTNRHLNDKEILKKSKDASIIITEWWTGAGEKLLQKKNLKAIIRCGVEIKNIDFNVANKNKVAVINVPDSYSNSVVELVICYIFALARNLNHFHTKTISGHYNEALIEMLSNKKVKFSKWPIFEVSGSTLGIIGFGSIGKLLRKKAESLGMKVLVYDPFCKKNKNINFVTLNYLLKNSKFVSLNASYNNNKYLISRKELNLMSKNSYIINTARGNLIETKALYKSIKDKKIAGAAIDVLETNQIFEKKISKDWKHSEDFANTKLNKFENIILTPHLAGITKETIKIQSEKVIKNVNLIFKGIKPKTIVNKIKSIKN